MEKWRQIPEYSNYWISDTGRLMTHDYNHTRKPKILNTFVNCYGYLACNLMQNGVRKRFLVHRLVGMAFKSDSWFRGATINHKNFNKLDNRVENLEWVTVSENLKHAHKNGAIDYASGETHYKSILTTDQVKDLKYQILLGIKGREIAENFNVSEKYVSAIKCGRSRKHEAA